MAKTFEEYKKALKEELDRKLEIEQKKQPNCDEEGCGDGEQIYDDGVQQGRYEMLREITKFVIELEDKSMGCNKNITYDKFPKQADEDYQHPQLGKRVEVCYHYDTSKCHPGTIVRCDIEEPFETIIQLDNGRFLRAVECQYKELR